jgi:hypothetical protein
MLRDPHESAEGDESPRLSGEPPRAHLGAVAPPVDAAEDADLRRVLRARLGDPMRAAFEERVGSHVPASVAASLRRRRP